MVKAKIYTEAKDKIGIFIESSRSTSVIWTDEIEIEGKLLKNLMKTLNKKGLIENANYRL